MSRESTVYDETAEQFLAVESALEATATSPAPVEGIVYDVQLVSPAALPESVRRRLAETASTLRLQDAAETVDRDDRSTGRPPRTELTAFPRPVVPDHDGAAPDWADELDSILPDQLLALTVVDPAVEMDLLPVGAERDELADVVGRQPVWTAFVCPESTETTEQLGLPTLSGLFDVVEDADSVAELNQRLVPLKPLDESTAFVHTHENRELSGVEFAIERTAFRAGNIVLEDGVCRIDPELEQCLEQARKTRQLQNDLVFGGLLMTIGALPVANLLMYSTFTSTELISPLLFSIGAVCLTLVVSWLSFSQQELETLAAASS